MGQEVTLIGLVIKEELPLEQQVLQQEMPVIGTYILKLLTLIIQQK